MGVLLYICVHGQIVSTVQINADTVQIGDRIPVTIHISAPIDYRIQSINFGNFKQWENVAYASDTVFLDKYADVDILEYGNWTHNDISLPIPATSLGIKKENGKQTITNTITISIYNLGVFALNGPNVEGEGASDLIPTQTKLLTVLPPSNMMATDSIALSPIKDIMREEANISDYLIYLYILGALLLMALVGYYFYKRKKNKVILPIETIEAILPPHTKALDALALLDNQQLWQQGKIKEYQSQLTFIIRQYLEERYQIKALEMTTDEIALSLAKADFDQKYTGELKEILQIADLVKFAKATPENDIHSKFMIKARSFVQNTSSKEEEL